MVVSVVGFCCLLVVGVRVIVRVGPSGSGEVSGDRVDGAVVLGHGMNRSEVRGITSEGGFGLVDLGVEGKMVVNVDSRYD